MVAHGSHIAGYEALLDLRSHTTDIESQEYALDLSVATQIVRIMTCIFLWHLLTPSDG